MNEEIPSGMDDLEQVLYDEMSQGQRDYYNLYQAVRPGLEDGVRSAMAEVGRFSATIAERGMLIAPDLTEEQWLVALLDTKVPSTTPMLVELAAMGTEGRHRALAVMAMAELSVLRRMVAVLEVALDEAHAALGD